MYRCDGEGAAQCAWEPLRSAWGGRGGCRPWIQSLSEAVLFLRLVSQVQIQNKKVDISKVSSKCGSKANIKHKPGECCLLHPNPSMPGACGPAKAGCIGHSLRIPGAAPAQEAVMPTAQ